MRPFACLSLLVLALLSCRVFAQTPGTWSASPGTPAVLLGEGFPVSLYRVCVTQGTSVHVRYVVEGEITKDVEIKLPGNCIDLKAKKIDVLVNGPDGASASGTYLALPPR